MRARLIVVVAAVALASFAGGWWMHRPVSNRETVRATAAYACPMHPQYRSDRPADCPACGMRLEPSDHEGSAATADDGTTLPPGTVRVTPERQQVVGVRLGTARRVTGTRALRTTGRVAPNENAVYPLLAGAEGWIREVRGATTGSLVRRHEVLATFYSPECVTAQQSFYSGLDTLARTPNEAVQAFNHQRVIEGIDRYANTLRNLGVSEAQLATMRTHRELVQDIHIVSPVDGFVLQRGAAAGLRFDRGFEFFRIADLRHVWILADVYENQLPFIRAGSAARVTSRDQNRQFEATVSRAEPLFDEATRTMKVRLDAANPGSRLKPGMFVDVEFAIEPPPSLAVPPDAVVDSGVRKIVFVHRGDGYFEPRRIETGWRLGEEIEVVKGLMEGEEIVISGTFLIDSESRMKAAAMGVFGATAKDPVCGMDVDERRATAAGRTFDHQGTTYVFCADVCRQRFADAPDRYLTADPPATMAGGRHMSH